MGTESKLRLSNGFSVDQLSTGNQESYQDVVLSVSGGVVGACVVVVVVAVVVVVVVVAFVVLRPPRNLCNRSLRRRKMRSLLSLSALWALAWLSVVTTFCSMALAAVVRTALGLVTSRMGRLPLSAMICLMRSQLDLARVKLHEVAPES